ncbi:unnamed protein product [Closterium sp. NIES-65]|nr:unnamed protein product [Closterium sp. NIES-65]
MAARIAARLLRGKGPDVAFAAAASGNAAEGVSAGSEGAVGSASAASEIGNPASGADVAAGEVIGAGEEAGEAEWGTYRDRRVAVRSFSGEARGEAVLDGTIFDVPVRRDIVHRVVLWQLAKRRQVRRRGVRGIGWEEEEYSVWGGGRRREGTRVGAERMEWVVNCIVMGSGWLGWRCNGWARARTARSGRARCAGRPASLIASSSPSHSPHCPYTPPPPPAQGTHSTKRACEVRGSSSKPWKQKGTGRARHGSRRGPQFRGGAAMHGPKPRSHAFSLNKKVRALGLKAALSARLREGQLVLYSDLDPGSPKTKDMAQHIATAFPESKKILFVDGSQRADETLLRASGNLHYVNVLPVVGLNVYSIVQHDALVLSLPALQALEHRLLSAKRQVRPGLEEKLCAAAAATA